jgi:hypothetical protein
MNAMPSSENGFFLLQRTISATAMTASKGERKINSNIRRRG